MVSPWGVPAEVAAAGDRLLAAASVAEQIDQDTRRLAAQDWRGRAADAFSDTLIATRPAAHEIVDSLQAASQTLHRYSTAQREAEASYEQAQADFDRAHERLRANPLDLGARFALLQAEQSALTAYGRLQEAAAAAAAELEAAAGLEPESHPWWDPFGWFTDPEPTKKVDQSITGEGAFTPDAVAQGSIGDCFVLSSVVSLLSSEEGTEFLQGQIRWDDAEEGYWVTIYPHGEAKEVFVSEVFKQGAKQPNGKFLGIFSKTKPSVAALYEAAIYQELGYEFLDGGVPRNGMAVVTGTEPEVISNRDYSGLTPNQTDQLRQQLAQGGQVVISSPRSDRPELTVQAPDGETRTVKISSSHSYAVTRIDPDGAVWMRNPWGPGNSGDNGGEFRVSPEDVAAHFWRATYTNVTDPY